MTDFLSSRRLVDALAARIRPRVVPLPASFRPNLPPTPCAHFLMDHEGRLRPYLLDVDPGDFPHHGIEEHVEHLNSHARTLADLTEGAPPVQTEKRFDGLGREITIGAYRAGEWVYEGHLSPRNLPADEPVAEPEPVLGKIKAKVWAYPGDESGEGLDLGEHEIPLVADGAPYVDPVSGEIVARLKPAPGISLRYGAISPAA